MSAELFNASKMAHDHTAACCDDPEFDINKHVKAVEAHCKAIGLHLQTAAEAMKNSSVVGKADPKTDLDMKPLHAQDAADARAKSPVVAVANPAVKITAAMALSDDAELRAKSFPYGRKPKK